ncbi:MAG TPA: DEAD/DEAH box helicase [Flavilitoribacter sp.]|nr:DEAD/DEAH box helicase [Flavilitoribacter sp.]
MDGLQAIGFETATPIQEKAIPAIMQKKDVLACAQTGTGKTAAFLLPLLHELAETPYHGIDTLILEPTRELAIQVDQQLEGLSYFTPVSSIAIYGGRDGNSMEQEKKALKGGVNVIVATPGRLIAHLNLGYVDLSTVRRLVLDEADRMLDMGFVHDIMGIVNQLPRKRQTLFFSATMPDQIRRFSRQILNQPEEINIAVSKPADAILQAAYRVEDEQKIALISNLLTSRKNSSTRTLIFAGAKLKVKEITQSLKQKGFPIDSIHSDLSQDEREQKLRAFKSGSLPMLVATDILSRGIDIRSIEVVINFDVPGDAEDYVHRIGRTARADASGVGLTFINRRDQRRFQRIEKLMGMKVRILPLPPEVEAISTDNAQKSDKSHRSGSRRRNFKGKGGGNRNRGSQSGKS